MPVIFIRDHTFEENKSEIYVKVPLRNINKKDLNLFVTDSYLKINHQVYMFECFLKHPSISDKTVVQVGQDQIVFKLIKQTPNLWGCLEEKIDKEEKIKLRKKALTEYRRYQEEKEKSKNEMKNDLKKFGVKEQIKIDGVNREWIEQEKKKELNKFDEEINEWKNHSNYDADNEEYTKAFILADANSNIEKTYGSKESVEVEDNKNFMDVNEVEATEKNNEIFQQCDFGDENEDVYKAPVKSSGNTEKNQYVKNNPAKIIKTKNKTTALEAIRTRASVKVNFTARHFPTPTRESLAHEENEWLRKQAEAKRIMEIEDKNLSEEEKNPVWLRNRGNDFFQSGNFLAAINAYTHAIRYGSKLPSLFLNRAACHLKMGNCFKCLEDCSKAQELLTPAVEANRSSRILMHVRKGTALITLKLFAEGLVEYEAALKLDPHNEKLKTDAEKIRVYIQTSHAES